MKKVIQSAIIIGIVAAFGCSSVSYTDPSGAKFTRSSLAYPLRLEGVEVTVVGTNGTRKTLTIKGYNSDQVGLLQAAVAGAVQGYAASQGVRPASAPAK